MPQLHERIRALALSLTLVAAGLAGGASTAGAQTFSLGIKLPTFTFGTGMAAVAFADFNGDGNPDLVTANDGSNNVAVLLGNGAGTMSSITYATVGSFPVAVVTGDFNGDGSPDIACANYSASTVTVLLNNGSGTFGGRVDYPVGLVPGAIATGDVNGDGVLDLLTADHGAGTVSVLLGNGGGGFAARTSFAGGANLTGLAVADVTGDGKLDVVVSDGAGFANVFPGDGAGHFGPMTQYALGGSPLQVVLADVNGDFRPDLVLASASTAWVLPSTGAGTFGSVTTTALSNSAAITIGDLNLDGRPDLVSAGGASGNVTVLPGLGNGTFGSPASFAVGANIWCVGIQDMNGDGMPDLVAPDANANFVDVLLAAGGLFGQQSDIAPLTSPRGVTFADLNADGKPDLVVASGSAGVIDLFLGNGAGGYSTHTTLTLLGHSNWIGAADLNGDGRLDLVATVEGLNLVSVFLGTGGGAFGSRTDFTTGSGPEGAAIADVNGDGKLDIVVTNLGASTVSVLAGNGLGGFAAKVDYTTGNGPSSVAVGQMNPSTDNRPDLVVSNFSAGTISLLLGTAGGFAAKVDYATSSSPNVVALADLNQDGRPDVVVANSLYSGPGTSTVSTFLSTGTGTLGARTDYPMPQPMIGLAVGDLNGDGRPDVVATEYYGSGGGVDLLLGNGLGGLAPQGSYYTGASCAAVALGDWNGDGRLDIAAANYGAGTVTVMPSLIPTTVALHASANTVAVGTAVTLSATVAAAMPSPIVPTGYVRFFDNGSLIGIATVVNGAASLPPYFPLAGNRTLIASFDPYYSLQAHFSAPQAVHVYPTLGPAILSVRDVPNDQGGTVKVSWSASPLESGNAFGLDSYWVLRSAPPNVVAAALREGATMLAGMAEAPPPGRRAFVLAPEGTGTYAWEYLGSSPVLHVPAYSMVAATTSDSVAGSNPRTAFMIQARTAGGAQYWFSAPDSGYSVDNLPPASPSPFTASYTGGSATLYWHGNTEPDLASYRVYRGTTASFTPSPANLVTTTGATTFTDAAGAPYWYKLAAVDTHGNASGFATAQPSGTAGLEGGAWSGGLMLAPPSPSPATRWTTLRFGLPRDGIASLRVYDLGGRLVREIANARFAAGEHTESWDLRDAAGSPVQGGMFFVRLETGAERRQQRLVVVR